MPLVSTKGNVESYNLYRGNYFSCKVSNFTFGFKGVSSNYVSFLKLFFMLSLSFNFFKLDLRPVVQLYRYKHVCNISKTRKVTMLLLIIVMDKYN